MSEKMTVVCSICEVPIFHGAPCPFCDSTETVVIEIDTDTPANEPAKLRVISGGRRDEDDERRAA
ncbi:MAG: hypothetical protein ACSLFD_05550 [Solirubrobacterales bacterium]